MRKIVTLFSFSLCLSACSWSNFPLLYKPDVQQGNVLAKERVADLKIGMNQDEVNYLLGTPVLQNTFANQDTVYVYTIKKGKGTMAEDALLLSFHIDRLIKIQQGPQQTAAK